METIAGRPDPTALDLRPRRSSLSRPSAGRRGLDELDLRVVRSRVGAGRRGLDELDLRGVLVEGLYVAVDQAGVGGNDDCDEFDDFWVVWLFGPDVDALVSAARPVLVDQQLTDGAYAFVTDPGAGDFRVGRRIDF